MPNNPDFTSGRLGCHHGQTDGWLWVPQKTGRDAADAGSALGRRGKLPGGSAAELAASPPANRAPARQRVIQPWHRLPRQVPARGGGCRGRARPASPKRLPWPRPRSGAEPGARSGLLCGAAMHPSLALLPCGKMEESPGWERGFVPFPCPPRRREKHRQTPASSSEPQSQLPKWFPEGQLRGWGCHPAAGSLR